MSRRRRDPARSARATLVLAAASCAGIACEESVELEPLVPGPGTATVVDSGGPEGDTGWWPSLVIDDGGTAHLTYCDVYRGDLRYAVRSAAPGASWRTETVVSDGAVGKYTTIALDSKGGMGIAFYDQDTKYLRYASKGTQGPPPAGEAADNGWRTERIAWGLEVGMGAELVFDARDVPHLFYYVPSGKLIHAYRNAEGAWVKDTLADATGIFSIRIDPVLRPDGIWISYAHWTFKDLTLYLAHLPNAGPVHTEVVDTDKGPGSRSQLFFEGEEPIVLYTLSHVPQLRLARRAPDGEGWISKLIMPDVGNVAAARTAEGTIVAAYEDVQGSSAGRGLVRYLRFDPRSNDSEVERFSLDPEGSTGAHLAMALDAQGRPVIAYYASTIKGLKVYDERP